MNIYILVEGSRTEPIVYPKLLEFLLPDFKRVDNYKDVVDKNYYLFSANGFPSILDDLQNAIDEINDFGNYDVLMVCLDQDNYSRISMEDRVNSSIIRPLVNCRLEIILQNKCFETWFLGNRKIVKRHPSSEFTQYLEFFNVRTSNPEVMGKFVSYENSESQFHAHYLTKMLAERKCYYSKSNPKAICTKSYINEMVNRVKNTADLDTFRKFVNLCESINNMGI